MIQSLFQSVQRGWRVRPSIRASGNGNAWDCIRQSPIDRLNHIVSFLGHGKEKKINEKKCYYCTCDSIATASNSIAAPPPPPLPSPLSPQF